MFFYPFSYYSGAAVVLDTNPFCSPTLILQQFIQILCPLLIVFLCCSSFLCFAFLNSVTHLCLSRQFTENDILSLEKVRLREVARCRGQRQQEISGLNLHTLPAHSFYLDTIW